MTANDKLQDILLDAPEVLTALMWPILTAIVVLLMVSRFRDSETFLSLYTTSGGWFLDETITITQAICYAVIFTAIFFILGP